MDVNFAQKRKTMSHSKTHVTIVVSGAGLAGLAFAVRMAQLEQNRVDSNLVRLIVLEAGHNDESRRGRYWHTMSLRDDIGGLDAINSLGLEAAVRGVATTSGMFVADAQGKLAISSAWFSRVDLSGVRLLRFQLWQLLLAHAQAHGVEVRWGAQVINADVDADPNGVTVEYTSDTLSDSAHGQATRTMVADLLVVADGARSVLRERLTDAGARRQFLNVGIVGAVVDGLASQMPVHLRARHGMLVGDRSLCFVSDEGHNAELVSVSLPIEREILRDDLVNDAALREQLISAAKQFPNEIVRPLLSAVEQNGDNLMVINALDRFPHAPVRGNVVFIGDASHAVSPFGGSGANMALVDGVTLAAEFYSATKNLHGDSTNVEVRSAVATATAAFFAATGVKCETLVHRQRSVVSMIHTNTVVSRVLRFVLLRVAPFLFAPGKVRRFAFSAGVLGGVIGAAYGIEKLIKHRDS